jgi:hypothetical protein
MVQFRKGWEGSGFARFFRLYPLSMVIVTIAFIFDSQLGKVPSDSRG